MAATAYAFVVSLMNTMDQIHTHPRLSTCFRSYQFQSLAKILDSLLDFVENHSDTDDSSTDLLSRIATVAQLTEDIIEVEAADQIRDLSTTHKTHSFFLDLQTKIQEMDSIINEEVIKLKQKTTVQDDLLPSSPPSSSSSSSSTSGVKKSSGLVGFDGYIEQLLDELTGYHSGRRILPIVGMGGVGKTTLATSAYENRLTVEHFDVRVWITVSQTFTVSDIFAQALSCLGDSTDKRYTSDDELGDKLRKNHLYGRRYLIVLDDLWTVEAWERIKFYFPENNNRSRIVVTTRQQELVDYFASSAVAVDLLDDKNSWELFRNSIFGHHAQGGGGTGGCPPELQQVGEKIVKRCNGLPLAITVIGGLLAKSPMTQEYWEKIAKDQSSSFLLEYSSGTTANNNPLSILYTSYKHLPIHLKSCFLYLGLFPEDHIIDTSELILFWIAEGFIKPNRNKSLEEVAESCIKELIDRNLLLVDRWKLKKKVRNLLLVDGWKLKKKVRSCYVHDLVRVLMIQIAEKENFHCVQRDIFGRHHFVVNERMASFYPRESLTSTSKWPVSVYHPLIFCSQKGGPFKSRLQRVMVDTKSSSHFEDVNWRLIMTKVNSPKLPFSILSLFWSLQTILVSNYVEEDIVVPVEIWKMPQLRHIDILKMHFPNPPTATATAAGDNKDVIVLHNLQTLRRLRNLSLSEEVCKRIPNIKKLRTQSDLEKDNDAARARGKLCFHLHNLKKLQELSIFSYIEDPLQNLKLPNSLEELTLGDCRLAWSDMEMIIGALPHLQSLELDENAVVGAEWNMGAEVEFLSLRHLRISRIQDLITWIAQASNFPVLEKLSLSRLRKLDEIPPGIGEIPTLEEIFVSTHSNKSLTMSAIKILEEQKSLGNEDLRLRLEFYSMTEAQRWKEQIQELGITSQNVHISIVVLDRLLL